MDIEVCVTISLCLSSRPLPNREAMDHCSSAAERASNATAILWLGRRAGASNRGRSGLKRKAQAAMAASAELALAPLASQRPDPGAGGEQSPIATTPSTGHLWPAPC